MTGEFDFFSQAMQVSPPGQVMSMDSREIAELVEKRHTHVLADIDAMLASLGIHSAGFSAQYNDATGRSLRCYRLPYRETMILVSGYRVDLRARVVDRWLLLEQSGANRASSLPDFTNPATAARAWAEQFERAQGLEPMARVAARISAAAGLRLLSEIGKINGIGPRKIFEVLAVRGLIFRDSRGDWVPYQEHIDSGYFVVRERTYDDDEGQPHIQKRTYVTAKGEVWLAKKLFAEENAS